MKYRLKGGQGPTPPALDPYSQLNEQQLAAVTAEASPVLIIAGAGSGKTRTLVSRAAHLMLKGTPPSRILMVTFTQKAAREMKDRVEALLGPAARSIWAGTFHHIGHRFLRNYAESLGFSKEFNIVDREDATDFLHAILTDLKVGPPVTAKKAASVFNMAQALQESLESVVLRRFPGLKDHVDVLEHLRKEYQARKSRQGVLDYDDLLLYWREILVSPAGEELRSHFDHVLVDEYQDTNAIQGEIVDLMAMDHRSITVVGDDAQAIYGFRGASPRNILSFTDRYPDAQVFRLEVNYRSSQEILDIANSVIAASPRVLKKTLVSHRGPGMKPVLISAYDQVQEAMFVCQRLWELHTEEGIPLNEIGVLYRAHHLGVQVQVELSKRGIPFKIFGGVKLFEQAHFKDLMSYIRVRRRPSDQIAVVRLFRIEPGLGRSTARTVASFLEQTPLEDTIHPFLDVRMLSMLGSRQKGRLHELGQFLAGLPEEPRPLMEAILTRYEPHLQRMYDDSDERLQDLRQLVEIAGQYSDLDELLADLGLEYGPSSENILEPPDEKIEDQVTLTSIHQAKGLEWTAVFLVGLYDGALPSTYSLSDLDAVEEERRILHVALTRAKDHLYITYPVLSPEGRKGRYFQRVSRFLEKIPADMYEKWELEVEE